MEIFMASFLPSIITDCSLCRFGIRLFASGLSSLGVSPLGQVLGSYGKKHHKPYLKNAARIMEVANAALWTAALATNWLGGAISLTITSALYLPLVVLKSRDLPEQTKTIIKGLEKAIVIAARILNIGLAAIMGAHVGFLLGGAVGAAAGFGLATTIAILPKIADIATGPEAEVQPVN